MPRWQCFCGVEIIKEEEIAVLRAAINHLMTHIQTIIETRIKAH